MQINLTFVLNPMSGFMDHLLKMYNEENSLPTELLTRFYNNELDQFDLLHKNNLIILDLADYNAYNQVYIKCPLEHPLTVKKNYNALHNDDIERVGIEVYLYRSVEDAPFTSLRLSTIFKEIGGKYV